MKFDAVIFDMDGVLLDSESRYVQGDVRMYRELGLELTPEDSKGLLGVNLTSGSQFILDTHPELGLTLDEMKAIYAASLLRCLEEAEDLTLMDGVEAWLRDLKTAGVKMAVASSSTADMVNHVVDRFHLRDYMDYVINGDMVTNGKPDPEIFLKAAAALGVTPERCAVVEDSTAGIQAARDAGMFCLAYSGANVHGVDQSGADVIVNTYTKETLKHLLG